MLPRTSEGLYLLQRLRDEAHRFAVTFHRQRRSKAMTASRLDGIPGLGEKRRKALLKRFGSVKRIRQASVEELADVPGHRACAGGSRCGRVGLGRRHHARGQPRDRRGRRRRRSRPCRRSPRRLTPQGADAAVPVPRVDRLRHRHRDERCRSLDGRQRHRGPRLVRRRQPAAAAALGDGRARGQGARQRGHRPQDRRGRRRAGPGLPLRAAGRPRGAARGRVAPAPHLPRRHRRGARAPVRERAPAAPAAGRGPAARRHPGRARDAARPAGRGPGRHRHLRPQRPPARPQAHPAARGRGRARACAWP